jgi:hypothetical protein
MTPAEIARFQVALDAPLPPEQIETFQRALERGWVPDITAPPSEWFSSARDYMEARDDAR